MACDDDKFMAEALAQAGRGRGRVEPNPMVGAVVARDGAVLACGHHERFGGPHAEVQALRAVAAAGANARDATVYVTLEPCCHHGKTPPCAQALIDAGVARVVVAMTDPDEKVAGKGIEILRSAGIDVTTGVLESQARDLLAAYIKLRTARRPWVICKWAQTADGYLALPPGRGRWISNDVSRARVHEVRSWCDGIGVGVGTVLADDPLLTNRSGAGKQPVRIVLDSHLRTPPGCQLLKTVDVSPVVVFAADGQIAAQQQAAKQLSDAGAEIVELSHPGGRLDIGQMLDELGRRQWTYLLIEGGRTVLESFLSQRLFDELLVFIAPLTAEDAPAGLPRLVVDDLLAAPAVAENLDGDRLLRVFRETAR